MQIAFHPERADLDHVAIIVASSLCALIAFVSTVKWLAGLAALAAVIHLLFILVQMARHVDYRLAQDDRARAIWRGFPSLKCSLGLVLAYILGFGLSFATLRAADGSTPDLARGLSAFLTFDPFTADNPSAGLSLFQLFCAVCWMLLAVPILGSRLADRSAALPEESAGRGEDRSDTTRPAFAAIAPGAPAGADVSGGEAPPATQAASPFPPPAPAPGSRFTPWLLCPLLALLLPPWRIFDLRLGLFDLLLLPLALWLGRRHGWQGAASVVVAGVGALVGVLGFAEDRSLLPNTSWLLLCVLAATHAAGLLPLDRIGQKLRESPGAWVWVLLVLPLRVTFSGQAVSTADPEIVELPWFHDFTLTGLFWVAIVIAGRARVEWSVLLLPATLIAATTAWPWALTPGNVLATLTGESIPPDYHPGFRIAGDVRGFGPLVQLFACFGFGRWLAGAVEPGARLPSKGKAVAVLGGLAAVALGGAALNWLPLEYLGDVLGVEERAFHVSAAPWELSALLLLLAGLWRGKRAVAILATMLFLMEIPWTEIEFFTASDLIVPLGDQFLFAGVFGGIGLWWRRRLGLPPPPAGGRHGQHALLLLGALYGLLPEEVPPGSEETAVRVLAALTLLGVVVAALVWLRTQWRSRPGSRAWVTDYEGWLALIALLAAGVAVAENIGQLRTHLSELKEYPDSLRALWADPEDGEHRQVTGFLSLLLVAWVVSLWMLLTTFATAVRKLRTSWCDLRRAVARTARFFGWDRLAAWSDVPSETPAAATESLPALNSP